MDLGWARTFDSFWLSDNQSPEAGLRILKETMLRLPPRYIDRWVAVRSLTNIQPDFRRQDSRLLSTDDATWTHARTFGLSYYDAFADGGSFGLSCDLAALSKDHIAHFKNLIGEKVQQREFWRTAVCRILCDTKDVVVFQNSDVALEEVHLLVIAERPSQRSVCVHPVLDPTQEYEINGVKKSAARLAQDGLVIPVGQWQANETILKVVR